MLHSCRSPFAQSSEGVGGSAVGQGRWLLLLLLCDMADVESAWKQISEERVLDVADQQLSDDDVAKLLDGLTECVVPHPPPLSPLSDFPGLVATCAGPRCEARTTACSRANGMLEVRYL